MSDATGQSHCVGEHLKSDPDWDLVFDITASGNRYLVLFMALSNKIFDQLNEMEPNQTALTIAEKTNFDELILGNILDTLAVMKLVECVISDVGPKTYTIAPAASTYLVSTKTPNMIGLVTAEHVVFQNCVQTYTRDSILETSQIIFKNVMAKSNFPGYMESHALGCIDAICRAVDFSPHRKVVDIGGCTGYIAREIAKRNPNLEVVVFDTVDMTTAVSSNFPLAPHEKVTRIGGDFFTDPIPSGDLFILGHIIHNWKDELVNKLLALVYKALDPGGILLVLEKINEPRNDATLAAMNVLMSILFRARERTMEDYCSLLTANGFVGTRLRRISGSNTYDVIVSQKPFCA